MPAHREFPSSLASRARLGGVGLSLLFAAVLAACGGADSGSQTAGAGPAPSSPAPAPAPGTTPAPAPGTTPAPAPGTTPAPAPGTTPAPAPGTTPAPAPGTTPAPAPGTTPAPAPGTTPAPAPAPGTTPAPAPAPGTTPAPAPAPTPISPPTTIPPTATGSSGIEASGLKRAPATTAFLGTDTYRAGIASFRKADKDGLSCANCHAPDGFDLAFFNFSTDLIRKRAAFHVPAADVENIVAMVNGLRQAHGITAPKDPFEFRPFQPGGRVLPGATDAERDLAFGRELVKILPTIMTGRVDTLAKARQAMNELRSYDPQNTAWGVPFARWSESIAHGAAHGTLNDYMPERPVVGKTAADRTAIMALHDAYIADPSPQNLWAIQDANDTLGDVARYADETGTLVSDASKSWNRDKTASMLFASHMLRQLHYGLPLNPARKGLPVIINRKNEPFAPFFGVGNHGNHILASGSMRPKDLPTVFRNTLSPERQTDQGFVRMMAAETIQPWWLLGWIMEPGMHHNQVWQHYFMASIINDRLTEKRYQIHHALVNYFTTLIRTEVPFANEGGPSFFNPDSTFRASSWFGPVDAVDGEGHRVWANQAHRDMYTRMQANLVRMVMIYTQGLISEQCAATGRFSKPIIGGYDNMEQLIVRFMRLNAVDDPENAAFDIDLANRFLFEADGGRHGCRTPFVANGTGPRVEAFTDKTMQHRIGANSPPLVPWEGYTSYSNNCAWLQDRPAGTTLLGSPYPFVTFRLTGKLVPRFTGSHQFNLGNFTGTHGEIVVAGQPLFRFGGLPGGDVANRPIQLQAGQEYTFNVITSGEFNCAAGGGYGEVKWVIDGVQENMIPITAVRAP
jgi:hypothetical protein